MTSRAVWGVAGVAVLGAALAALLWFVPVNDAPPAVDGVDVVKAASPADEALTTPQAGVNAGTVDEQPAADRPRVKLTADQAIEPELDGLFVQGMEMEIGPLPSTGSERDREDALQQRLLRVTGEVVGAAEAHTEYALTAPRHESDAAVQRAVSLYEHLADTVRDVPVPDGLGPDEQQVYRTMIDRMSEKHARKAASLRAQGVPR